MAFFFDDLEDLFLGQTGDLRQPGKGDNADDVMRTGGRAAMRTGTSCT